MTESKNMAHEPGTLPDQTEIADRLAILDVLYTHSRGLDRLDDAGIPYSDYGTAFAAEWHQVFFRDPEGNVIEVHQQVV